MKGFSIGEVEKITGIKSHTLRYWEENVPILQPKKDLGGRRIYSSHDLGIIYRLDYLINKKKYTVEGAADEIINQSAAQGSLTAKISELRDQLLDIYGIIREEKNDGTK